MPIVWIPDTGSGADVSVTIEVAFDSTAFDDTPTWTDITEYVRTDAGVQITRGRTDEQGQVSPATCTMLLRNSDKRFTPGYVGGPYGSNVKPRKQVRVTITHDAVDYVRFYGYAQTWEQEWPGGVTESATVRLVATDLLGILGTTSLRQSHAETVLRYEPISCYPLTEAHGPAFDVSDVEQPRMSKVSRQGGGTIDYGNSDGKWPANHDLRTVFVKNSTDDGAWSALTVALDYQSATTALGYGLWVKYDANRPASGYAVLSSLSIDATYSLCLVLTSGGATQARVLDLSTGTSAKTLTADSTVDDGRWHYVYLTYTEAGSGVASIRVDRQAATTSSAIGGGYPTVSATGRLTIGAGYDGTTKYATPARRAYFSHPSVWIDTDATSLDSTILAEDGRSDVLASSRTSDRISWLLDVVNFPTAKRNIEAGATDVPSSALSQSSALDYAQSVAGSELGVFFANREGDAAFHARAHRWTTASSATLDYHEVGEVLRLDVDSIATVAEVQYVRNGGGTVRAVDLAGRATYGRLARQLDTSVNDANAAFGLAELLLAQRASLTTRLDGFTWNLMTQDSDADNAAVLALDLGDRITLDALPSTAHTSQIDVWIEGVSEVIAQAAWSVTFTTSPHVDLFPFGAWVLGTATLGDDTILGY